MNGTMCIAYIYHNISAAVAALNKRVAALGIDIDAAVRQRVAGALVKGQYRRRRFS